ncbi:MAG: Uma2 family endonuclease [Chloroflexi bacterium]|nr:Uma2 family endonuclease [Chloroflexota bacterium]MCY3588854.1 Uma2 family endonuclease [Chloroflexota bacterium]MCY3685715.1 Uma2 family endonuclease [Chloroflexota bacterium]MDE2709199.1 Uma2 family endonuclease [Chloroflexota bacterium]
MTTAKQTRRRSPLRLPDIPRREPDEVTAYDHLHQPGNAHHLAMHLIDQGADPERLLVTADRWIVQDLPSFRERARYPDLLVAFDVDPERYRASNGYVIVEQGKPPDFVLEIASASTGQTDIGAKRDDYETFGIREYWRFDETGEHHGERLAGDRLVGDRYEPIAINALPDGTLEGYSEALDLKLRWQAGSLGWHHSSDGRHIATFADERARAERAEARSDAADARAEAERRARATVEARVRELEERLRGTGT